MKLPGMGEVKNKNLLLGGSVVVGIVGYAYWKKRKRIPTASADGSTTSVDPNAIDPSTGVPYGQEQGSGGYYVGSSVANPYVSQGSTITQPNPQAYTTNTAWISDAEQYAQNVFGVSYGTAASGLGKYIRQDPHGLNPDEYAAVSEVVGLIGPPPVGTFRLIQAAPTPTPPSGSGSGSGNGEPDGGGSHPPPPPPVQQHTPGTPVSPQPPPYLNSDGTIGLPGWANGGHPDWFWTGTQWVYAIPGIPPQ